MKKFTSDESQEVIDLFFGIPLNRSKKSGKVPAGDTRLTINISVAHHKKLRIAAIKAETTAGELIEKLIDENLSE